MGSTFMPMNAASLDTIPRHQLQRATVLNNVFRQLCGAFGTAMFASLLLERQNFHRALLTQTVTPNSLGVVQALSAMQTALRQQGIDESQVGLLSLSGLARQITQSANVRGFDDCFYFGAGLALFALVPMLWVGRSRR
jgi:hypothetical protein